MKRFSLKSSLGIVSAILMLTLAASNLEAQTNKALHITDITIVPGKEMLNISMVVNPNQYRQARNSRMVVTPVVRSLTSTDSITLPPFVVAGTNSWYNIQRNNLYTEGTLLRSGKGNPFTYTAQTPTQPWMMHSRIDFITSEVGCCNASKGTPVTRPIAEIDLRQPLYTPHYQFNTDVAASPKTRSIEGKAYINFPVNKIEIYPDYMVNPVELHKITGTIDSVKNNTDITVKTIRLVGFASPEGPYSNNVRLAAGRTQALKEYVRKQYTFPASVFKTASVPEDWQGLREAIVSGVGNLADTTAMIAFIDDPYTNIETKNDRFAKQFPSQYEWLLKNVYPTLRHTNYEIIYDVRVYTDINEIREIIKTRPQDLSLNEFYLAAKSYPEGSAEQDEVYMLAAMLNPNNSQANFNAASAALRQGNTESAAYFLNKCDNSPAVLYAKATLAAMQKDYTLATNLFTLAKNQGDAKANEALQQLQQLIDTKPGVTFLPESTQK